MRFDDAVLIEIKLLDQKSPHFLQRVFDGGEGVIKVILPQGAVPRSVEGVEDVAHSFAVFFREHAQLTTQNRINQSASFLYR